MPNIIKRVAKSVTKPIVNRYHEKEAERKEYKKKQYDRQHDPEVQMARDSGYRKAALAGAEQEGADEYKKKRSGQGSLRQGVSNSMIGFSMGSAKALESGAFGVPNGSVFGSIEDVTGMGGSGRNTLDSIENLTMGTRPKATKVASPNVQGQSRGSNIIINVGGSSKGGKRKLANTVPVKKQRDWQDDVSDLTGF